MKAVTTAAATLTVAAFGFVAAPERVRDDARVDSPAPAPVGEPRAASAGEGAPRVRLQPPALAAPAAAAIGFAAEIETLRSSPDPRDLYRAFRLIERCIRAREFDAYMKSRPPGPDFAAEQAAYGDGESRMRAACQDISPAQIAVRLSLAEAAARAGVPGAVSAWTAEGPFGDRTALTQRPDDPLVVDWVRQAIEMIKAAAKRDDIDAIRQYGVLSLNWEFDDIDRVIALMREAAQRNLQLQTERLLAHSSRPPGAVAADVADAASTGQRPAAAN